MSLFSRLKNVVAAKASKGATETDNPARKLSLYIEQASEHLRDFRVQVSRAEARCVSLEKEIQDSQLAADQWHEQAKEALQQSREDKAREALEREHQERRDEERLTAELAETKARVGQLKQRYEKLEQRLEEVKKQQDRLARRSSIAEAEYAAAEAMEKLSLDNPLAEFEAVEHNVEHQEAQAEAAYSTLNSSLSSELADLKEKQADKNVDDALSQLKKEVGKDEEK